MFTSEGDPAYLTSMYLAFTCIPCELSVEDLTHFGQGVASFLALERYLPKRAFNPLSVVNSDFLFLIV